jgi:hypothetical protein
MDGETNGVRKLDQSQLEIFSSSTKKRISALGHVHRALEAEGELFAKPFHTSDKN